MKTKSTFTLLFFLLFMAISNNSCAQKLAQVSSDAKKLELNQQKFIGHPLKELLKEIEPKIESAIARSDNPTQASFINFYFINTKGYNEYRRMDKFPLTIKVYLKGTFIWNIKPGDDYLKWTKEDEKKYGNLIIEGIRVYNDK